MLKLYEYTKEENEKSAKIFGFPIIKQTFDYMTGEKRQSFLGGIVTRFKVSDLYIDCCKKEIKLFGHPFMQCLEQNNYKTYLMFGKTIRKISLFDVFKKKYFKYFNKKHDDIYILSANSGEIYLTLTYIIDALIKRNESKNPLLVATKKYHIDMIKMLCPEIPYIYIKKCGTNIIGKEFKIDHFRFFLLYDSPHFKQVIINIKNNPLGTHHYFKSILNTLKITNDDLQYRKITVPLENESSMLNKIAKTGLNLNNFVFLAPEAKSCKLYDENFWCELINQLQEKGYDVFVNLVENDINLKGTSNYKTCYLDYAEAFALAQRSKRIVSLRSGLTEFLLQTGVPIDALYTKFKQRYSFYDMDIYHAMSGFGMAEIPFVDKTKIREFNMNEISSYECLEKIMVTL